MYAFEFPSRHMTPPSTLLLELSSKLDAPISKTASPVLALTYITPPSSWAFSPRLFLISFFLKLERPTLKYLELFPTYIAEPLTAMFCSKSHENIASAYWARFLKCNAPPSRAELFINLESMIETSSYPRDVTAAVLTFKGATLFMKLQLSISKDSPSLNMAAPPFCSNDVFVILLSVKLHDSTDRSPWLIIAP